MPKLKIYNGQEWIDIAKNGKSAYELWRDAGNTGTQQEFLRALKGKDGYTPVKGKDYFDGKDANDTLIIETVREVVLGEANKKMEKEAATIRRHVSSKTYALRDLSDMQSATPGQIPVKQADGTWAPGDQTGSGGSGVVETIVAGTGISVDSTDPANPIVTATGGGGSGINRTIVVTSGNVTAGADADTDYVYKIAGAHTVTLPTAVSNTNQYDIINLHTASVSLATTSSQTIHGTSAPITLIPNQALTLQSDGTNWMIK